ncbi:cysteine hydrolase family protein [Cupriavidus nantongensis]|uniref:cysteine hydrolase family protein n=1 Tax=Cupriavidus nantongensis TaxID=1796606 RepID=UPI00358FCAB5
MEAAHMSAQHKARPTHHIDVEARPKPLRLPLHRCALVVIDMQHQFCSPGGLSHDSGADIGCARRVIDPIQRLLSAFRDRGLPVIHTREGFLPDLSDCPPSMLQRIQRNGQPLVGQMGALGRILVRGEPGHEIIPELAPAPGEIIIDKPGIGTFGLTDLESILHRSDVDHLLVTGVTTDVCVHTFIREANDRGFNCVLIEDACASFDPELHAAAVAMTVQQGGLFGWVASTGTVIRALDQSTVP